ncbi:proteinase inhibitor [Anoxybacillus rupiensis]|jgi:Intracellular proteinase inhibitor|uniref:BsuPI-related putative proteinase inhibitor n=1 Tax=Anoxybacteroides rupiense TaxID=311460 RepID=UPI001BA62922|nr:BsuPI-related putative proteinase inhibitor [Anoxybacillus rupiensis]MBS2771316.1 proteinase inhibitor [Anoxybacillus rupiensis]
MNLQKKAVGVLLSILILSIAWTLWNEAIPSIAKQRKEGPQHRIVAGTLEPSLTYQKQNGRYLFIFSVKNQTEREQKVTFTSSQTYDYILYRNGKKFFQFSDGKMFTPVYEERMLKQGEELSFRNLLPPLPKGQYTITWWLADPQWPEAKATMSFSVN